jgi:endonuclease YncB( thermonuclease family)
MAQVAVARCIGMRLLAPCFLGLATLVAAGAAGAGDFSKAGRVTRVVDGDTVDVRLDGGRAERVRVLGIDTPERGDCGSAAATAATRQLAGGRHVTLVGDATQDTRDRYGRLLAYVWLPGGRDLGYRLVATGHARVYVYGGRPFTRLPAYEHARSLAGARGIWACGRASAPSKGRRCRAGYFPCLRVTRDLDCDQIPDALEPIRVTGSDPYRLDADGDGLGCE